LGGDHPTTGKIQYGYNTVLVGFIFVVFGIVSLLPNIKSRSKYSRNTKRKAFTIETKELVLERQGHCCNICGTRPQNWDFDHIGSRGDNSARNCQALCLDCHRDKTLSENRQRKKRK
jgi:5-methylcytosine-specific restriction endonuclease McrA